MSRSVKVCTQMTSVSSGTSPYPILSYSYRIRIHIYIYIHQEVNL